MAEAPAATISVNGVELEYVEDGTGVPVVFVHGSASDLRYWEPQREAFAARYRFCAYTRRFHGKRSWPREGDYSADAHVYDLVAITRWLDAGPVHLVGFSTALALRMLLRDPDLVRSLTIVEPNIPWLLEGSTDGEAVAAWWRDENARVRTQAGADPVRRAELWFELVNNRGPGTFAPQPEGLRRMWLDNFSTPRPAVPPQDPLTCEQLSAITTPTLLIAGEYGMPYSRRIADRLAGCIPGTRFVVIPGATHFMSYQDPAAFNEVVLDFIARH